MNDKWWRIATQQEIQALDDNENMGNRDICLGMIKHLYFYKMKYHLNDTVGPYEAWLVILDKH